MVFEVRVHPEAARFIQRLDSKTQQRIKNTLFLLKEDPFRSRPTVDIKKLRGTKGRHDLFRLRMGDYRAIYSVEGKIVWVTDVFRREKGYAGL